MCNCGLPIAPDSARWAINEDPTADLLSGMGSGPPEASSGSLTTVVASLTLPKVCSTSNHADPNYAAAQRVSRGSATSSRRGQPFKVATLPGAALVPLLCPDTHGSISLFIGTGWQCVASQGLRSWLHDLVRRN